MKFRRGFKTEADAHARELRAELGLSKEDPLCPWKLSDYLGIPIVKLSTIVASAPDAIDYLMTRGKDHFSAVTIFGGNHGRSRVICHNDGHAKTRQAANLAHELSHAILGHPPTPAFDPNDADEAEAKWLGPALLVSKEAATHIAFQEVSVPAAARQFGVSESLMRMRLNVTGALIRAQRSRKRAKR